MREHRDGLSSVVSELEWERLRLIAAFWNDYSTADAPGAATREVLDQIQRQTAECLCQSPPNLDEAERLIAKALLLISGCDGE